MLQGWVWWARPAGYQWHCGSRPEELDPRKCNIGNCYRGHSRSAGKKFKVAANFDDVEQHPLERRRYCRFTEWFAESAVLNALTICAYGKVAADRVDPTMKTVNAPDENTFFDFREKLVSIVNSGRNRKRMDTNTRCRSGAPNRRPGGAGSSSATGV